MIKLSKNMFKALAFSIGIFVASPVLAANFEGMSFMGAYPEMHPTTKSVFVPLMEKTKKDLKNVSFNYFADNALYPISESYAALNDGRVDFGVLRPSQFPGVLNTMNLINVPGLARNSIVGSLVAYDVLQKFDSAKSELPKNSVALGTWAGASYQICTINPVKTLADVKGKKLIAWNGTSFDIAKALGANPIRLAPSDTYLSLSKGMADGIITPLASLRSYKLTEIAKHHLVLDLGVNTFTMSAFKPLWDEFTPAIQNFFTKEFGQSFSLAAGKSLAEGEKADVDWMKNNGHTLYYPTQAELAEVAKLLAPFKQDWLAVMKKAGNKNPEEILKYAEERAAYYQAEFEKGTYGKY